MPSLSQLTDLTKEAARHAGFDLAGIAPIEDCPELRYFPEWILEERQGEMRYLESRTEDGRLKRASVRNAAPWARSVIVCALNYNTEPPYSTELGFGNDTSVARSCDGRQGWISRYAWGQRDYHDVILPRLRNIEAALKRAAGEIRTWCYVDTGPVIERVSAKYAGIGWIGKNACIINQERGSWLFLGVILTSLDLQPDMPAPDRCGTCTLCLSACPTDAFLTAHRLDASRCISYLTIEKRGEIPEPLRAGMGQHVFGCDICQDVCPWNNQKSQKPPITDIPDFKPRELFVAPDLEWLATISDQEFRETFRGSPVKRAKRIGLRRNAVVAMGNSGNVEFVPILRRIAEEDPDEAMREHANWALERLRAVEDARSVDSASLRSG